jgi:hypothetical protein
MVIHTQVMRVAPIGVSSGIVLTGLGATALVVSAFLDWTRNIRGTQVSWRAVVDSGFGGAPDLGKSVGGAAILIGLVAMLGLFDVSGLLTALAGVAGVFGSVLFLIHVQRSADHGLQGGMWLALAGSVVCVVAGLGGTRGAVAVGE